MDKMIGFSTGACHLFPRKLSIREIITLTHDMGCNAIEINWHSAHKEKPTVIDTKHLRGHFFDNVSLHLPVDIDYLDNTTTQMVLAHTSTLLSSYHFKSVVVHPNNVKDWRMFKVDSKYFNTPVSIENMDNRKDSFKDLDSFVGLLEKHRHINLVFDVNHWIVNGNSIESVELALQKIWEKKIRLSGIHISGFNYHDPLCRSVGCKKIVKSISKVSDNVPIIIESVCKNVDELKKEFNFVLENL